MERILISQKKIVRSIMGVGYLEHCKPLFKELKIMTVFSLYFYNLALYAFKNKHKFMKNSDINTGIQTRNASCFSVPTHKTSAFERSIFYMAIKTYNRIEKLKLLKNTRANYRTVLKTFFIDNPYYSFNEFFG